MIRERGELSLIRVDSDREVKVCEKIVFMYRGKKFTITPDFDEKFRINKIDKDNGGNNISVLPAYANEILVS